MLQPHSRLAPARWVTAAQTYIRDSAASSEALRLLGEGKGKKDEKGDQPDE